MIMRLCGRVLKQLFSLKRNESDESVAVEAGGPPERQPLCDNSSF